MNTKHSLDARLAYREGDKTGCNVRGTVELSRGDFDADCPRCIAWLDQQPLALTPRAERYVAAIAPLQQAAYVNGAWDQSTYTRLYSAWSEANRRNGDAL